MADIEVNVSIPACSECDVTMSTVVVQQYVLDGELKFKCEFICPMCGSFYTVHVVREPGKIAREWKELHGG
jgi:hypothetical protein